VSRTATTDANGKYQFNDLTPGTYNVVQANQPDRYRDGKDRVGDTLDGLGVPMPLQNGVLAPDLDPTDFRDGDGFEEVFLDSGFAALNYDFGELAITTGKTDFIRPIFYR
jgi:hypothetical protein